MRYLILFVLNYINFVYSSNESNITQQDLDTLNEMLTKKLNWTKNNDNKTFNFVYDEMSSDNGTDTLDLILLDIGSQGKILNTAKRKYEMADEYLKEKMEKEAGRRYEGYWQSQEFSNKSMEIMQQSIYSTRYRLQETRELRIKYAKDISYHLAMLYGALMMLRIKIDNIYATLQKLQLWHKFYYFLLVYERCVAVNVDVSDLVQRFFYIAEFFKKMTQEGNESDEESVPQNIFG